MPKAESVYLRGFDTFEVKTRCLFRQDSFQQLCELIRTGGALSADFYHTVLTISTRIPKALIILKKRPALGLMCPFSNLDM